MAGTGICCLHKLGSQWLGRGGAAEQAGRVSLKSPAHKSSKLMGRDRGQTLAWSRSAEHYRKWIRRTGRQQRISSTPDIAHLALAFALLFTRAREKPGSVRAKHEGVLLAIIQANEKQGHIQAFETHDKLVFLQRCLRPSYRHSYRRASAYGFW
ncbi:hypothetical protein B0H19DRAFT_1253578 [Mycena capillaripes]|nr:hypothetical protein B0H19DRAFT_1253578 [Mycena capillaripes]